MAHPNIDERRDVVKKLLDTCGITLKDVRRIAKEFHCSNAAVHNDIITIEHGTTSNVSPSMKRKIIERDGYVCYLCNKHILPNQIIIEHKIPARAGGRAIESNLFVACQSCNSKKIASDRLVYPDYYLNP